MLRLLNSHRKRGDNPCIEQEIEEPLTMMDKLELSVEALTSDTGPRWKHEPLSNKFLPYVHHKAKPRITTYPNGKKKISVGKKELLMTNGALVERAEKRDDSTTSALPHEPKNQLTSEERKLVMKSSHSRDGRWSYQLDCYLAALSEVVIEPKVIPFGLSYAEIRCKTIQIYFEVPIPADENKFFPVDPKDVSDASVIKILSRMYPETKGLTMTKKSRSVENPMRIWEGEIHIRHRKKGHRAILRCYRKGGHYRFEIEVKKPPMKFKIEKWESERYYYLAQTYFELEKIGKEMESHLKNIFKQLNYKHPKIDIAKLEEVFKECGVKGVGTDDRVRYVIRDLVERGEHTPALLKNKKFCLDNGAFERMVSRGILRVVRGTALNGDCRENTYILTETWRNPKPKSTKTSKKEKVEQCL